jgi:hypothetical protein
VLRGDLERKMRVRRKRGTWSLIESVVFMTRQLMVAALLDVGAAVYCDVVDEE